MISKRSYMWDNMKALLIYCVVLGHFLEKIPMDSTLGYTLDFFIYTFHMPAFIFISGFWSKGYCKDSKVRAEKVSCFVAYYLIFQVLFTLIAMIYNPDKILHILNPAIGLWYLLAMIAYYLFIPIVEKLPAPLVIICFFVMGLLITCEKNASSFAAISRIFVFAPFFFIGYYMTDSAIQKLRTFKLRYLVAIISLVTSLYLTQTVKYWRNMRKVFYGKANYKELDFSKLEAIEMRSLGWLMAGLVIVALVILIPNCKIPVISNIGKNSIQVFLFHFPIIILLVDSKFAKKLLIDTPADLLVTTLISLLITVALSTKVFSYPFKWIQLLVNKAYSIKNTTK